MLALVDLWFADEKTKKAFDCAFCLKNPIMSQRRKCQLGPEAFGVKPVVIDARSLKYNFCPGLALQNEQALDLFKACRIAMETGIMPSDGDFSSQDGLFVAVFFDFIAHWRQRQYGMWWYDIQHFTKSVLEAIFGKKKGR